MKAMQIALRMVTDRNQCQQNAICSFTRRNVLIAELDAGGGVDYSEVFRNNVGGGGFFCVFYSFNNQ